MSPPLSFMNGTASSELLTGIRAPNDHHEAISSRLHVLVDEKESLIENAKHTATTLALSEREIVGSKLAELIDGHPVFLVDTAQHLHLITNEKRVNLTKALVLDQSKDKETIEEECACLLAALSHQKAGTAVFMRNPAARDRHVIRKTYLGPAAFLEMRLYLTSGNANTSVDAMMKILHDELKRRDHQGR